MFSRTFGMLGLLIGIGAGLGGCTDGYGYSGVNVGYGSGGYYDPGYGYAGYGGGYGAGFAPSYFGWYDNFYYPGTGIYVYDQNRRRHRWNDGQRRYWEGRRGTYRGGQIRDNWADFRRDVQRERRDYRGDIRQNRQALRNGTITRDQFRDNRQQARRDYRGDVRREWRETRRENRGVRQGRPNGGGARAFRGGGQGPRGRGGGRPPRNIP